MRSAAFFAVAGYARTPMRRPAPIQVKTGTRPAGAADRSVPGSAREHHKQHGKAQIDHHQLPAKGHTQNTPAESSGAKPSAARQPAAAICVKKRIESLA